MSELTLQAARKIDPKRVALGLAAIWTTFTLVGIAVDRGYGAWTLQAFNLVDSDLDRRLSMPASFTALLLLLSAGLALALAGVDRAQREKTWRLAAFALLAFGVEELLGVHSWLEDQGASWGVSYLPLLGLGTAALLGALGIFKREAAIQALFGGAIVLWLAGGALDNPAVVASNSGAEILEMAAAALFALSLLERLRYLARQYYPLDEEDTRLSLNQIAAETLDRVKLRPLAIGLALATAAFAIQYVLLHTGNYHHAEKLAVLDLNNEQTVWATFQGSLIFAVGGLAILTSRLRATPAGIKRWWLCLGLVLLILGADEIVAIHDRFQDATDLPGQIILMPVAVVGIAAWLEVFRGIRDNRLVRGLFIAGAVAWFLSQAIDVTVQGIFRWTITPEEVGETTGSVLWLFSLLCWLRAVLPVGLIPPDAGAGQLGKGAIIKPLAEPERRERAPTG